MNRHNACADCGQQILTNLCGFGKREDGTTFLLCLPCKEDRKPGSLRRGLDHPGVGLEVYGAELIPQGHG